MGTTRDSFTYVGKELEIFEAATNWKNYFSRSIQPYLKGSVLEVGAGLGSTTRILNNGTAESWTMLEPDTEMFTRLISDKSAFPDNTKIHLGTIENVTGYFDSIIYIDVLEHIESDKAELTNAVKHLKHEGTLIVLAPAFSYLFSPFDRAIGHFRRYNKNELIAIAPPNLKLKNIRYLDSMGFGASLANKILLQQKIPSLKQVFLWDKYLIPISKKLDKLFHPFLGKSILAIWQATH